MTEAELLLNIIVQRPVVKRAIKCYSCAESLKLVSTLTTLLGFLPGGEDPNHITHSMVCGGCNKKYIVNYKSNNMWVTEYEIPRVIEGVSSCFETVIYTCSDCGGDVVQTHYDLDGRLKDSNEGLMTSYIEGRGYAPQYITRWGCVVCGRYVEK